MAAEMTHCFAGPAALTELPAETTMGKPGSVPACHQVAIVGCPLLSDSSGAWALRWRQAACVERPRPARALWPCCFRPTRALLLPPRVELGARAHAISAGGYLCVAVSEEGRCLWWDNDAPHDEDQNVRRYPMGGADAGARRRLVGHAAGRRRRGATARAVPTQVVGVEDRVVAVAAPEDVGCDTLAVDAAGNTLPLLRLRRRARAAADALPLPTLVDQVVAHEPAKNRGCGEQAPRVAVGRGGERRLRG